jgi:hypothetical protein
MKYFLPAATAMLSVALCLPLVAANAPPAARQLKLLTPDRYLPGLPLLVRLEVLDGSGRRDWSLWNAEATLSSSTPGVMLSTNRVVLRNGLGSALVSISGAGDFSLIATLGGVQTNRLIHSATNIPVRGVGGILPGGSTIWIGIILVTNDVIVPLGHTLMIDSNTIVLLNGVTNGSVANDISVNGSIAALGTEQHPVTITCAEPGLRFRWGQIRHNNSQDSIYRYTTITRGGRSTGEGHTDTAPVIRAIGTRIIFESCNITDQAEWSKASPEFGQPGKILQSSLGSDITFDDCLLARARMGPEVAGTTLLVTNSYIVEMYGTNDSDGLFLDADQIGPITISGSVLAEGEDDGIDTFGAVFRVENSIIRDWRNPFEDTKGISVDGGEARIDHCLMVDNVLGISGKGNNAVTVRVHINQSTILSQNYAVGATNKSGTTPFIDYRITNSIIRGQSDSVFTQYNPADIHFYYCNIGESWAGVNCSFTDPMFADAANNNYDPQPYSPLIDAGDPSPPRDRDGSARDVGHFTFVVPSPMLGIPRRLGNGNYDFSLNAYPNRNYAVESSLNLQAWNPLTTVLQTNASTIVTDSTATNALRFYRAKLVTAP